MYIYKEKYLKQTSGIIKKKKNLFCVFNIFQFLTQNNLLIYLKRYIS